MMKWKNWVLLLTFSLIYFLKLSGQSVTVSDSIVWKPFEEIKISDKFSKVILNFENCQYDNPGSIIPLYVKRIPISVECNEVQIEFSSIETEFLNIPSNIKFIFSDDDIPIDFKVSSNIFSERKIPYLNFSIIPIRRQTKTSKIELLKSFTIKFTPSNSKNKTKNRVYAQNSILSSGDWYKFSVKNSGVTKITYSDLNTLGINPSEINPSQISVFGNGGVPLPELNALFRYDDLQECAIEVIGGSDGSFDIQDYILFYAKGPIGWVYNQDCQCFKHITNPFSDYSYYFINVNSGIGQKKRISTKPSISENPTSIYNSFTDYAVYEKDNINLAKSGKEWFGETFDVNTTYTFPFKFNGINTTQQAKLILRLAAYSNVNSNFTASISANTFSIGIGAIPFYNYRAITSESVQQFTPSSSILNLSITYSKPQVTSVGWLDYAIINVNRYLKQSDSQVAFRVPEGVGVGNISEYQLAELKTSSRIWDVSDYINPVQVDVQPNAGSLIFRDRSDSLKEYVLFDGTSYLSILPNGKVSNQNLHSLPTCDMIIISHSLFMNEAERLANYNRTSRNLNVQVVNIAQIYNEFSSGNPDPTAIRDYIKMYYDRFGETSPKYLLLFGDASYDYKNVLGYSQNLIPTYENYNSTDDYSSWASDDYFGLLDNNEGVQANGTLDIGIGRFVVLTVEQATQMVDKTIRYSSQYRIQPELITQHSNFGDWRTYSSILADDEDNNIHISDADKLAKVIENNYKMYNVEKIYFDSYPQTSFSGGQRYPDVENAINQRMNKGSLFINYVGHGGEVGWAHERVVKISDILQWNNKYNLPIFITATCEFTRFDDPARVSAGELVFLNANGGAVAMFTTSRVAWSNTNYSLNNSLLSTAFHKDNGVYAALGDMMRIAKNVNVLSSFNIRNFILAGDPSLIPSYPKHQVVTTQINGVDVGIQADTIGAFSHVTISGKITDENGILLSGFNGTVFPTVFDKPSQISTLKNDPGSAVFTYLYQKNILFKGKVKVTNGLFTFNFIVPKDISYNYGFGKISYYAYDNNEDAAGYFNNFIVGGIDTNNLISDDLGPVIKIVMNNDKFVSGGLTNENPILIAYVKDSTGINTISNGIGHDAIAIIDGDVKNSIVINDYYESDLDSYNSGSFKYPLRNLKEGKHTLTVKVWDIMNNSSQQSIDFIVVSSKELSLNHVLNYPNPFTTSTHFFFEQNQPESQLDVQLSIFTISGKLVKTIKQSVMMSGFRSDGIFWDGCDDFGDKLAKGIYLYRIKVKNEKGDIAEKTEKIVIL